LLQELVTAAAGDAHHQPRARRASDETLAVHAGEKLGKKGADVGGTGTETETDSIATPIVSGTTHWFKSSEDLIAFKEGRRHSFEYGRYSNPTVKVQEDKISALERAEATLVTSSGMNAITTTSSPSSRPAATWSPPPPATARRARSSVKSSPGCASGRRSTDLDQPLAQVSFHT